MLIHSFILADFWSTSKMLVHSDDRVHLKSASPMGWLLVRGTNGMVKVKIIHKMGAKHGRRKV